MNRAPGMAAVFIASLLAIFTVACGGGNPEDESIGGRGGVAGATPDQRPASGTTTAGTTGVPGSEGPGTTLSQDPGAMTSSSLEDAADESSATGTEGAAGGTASPQNDR